MGRLGQKYNEILPHTSQNCYLQKKWTHNKAGEDVEKKELSYSVSGNVNWCSCYRRQSGGSLKN